MDLQIKNYSGASTVKKTLQKETIYLIMYTKTKNALQRKWNWGIITPIQTGGAKMTENTYVSMHTAMAHIPLQDPSGLITTKTMD